MKAITTTYRGPTDTRGSRIIARAEGVKSLSIPYPHELSGDDCHRKAAQALADRQGWEGCLICGGLPNGDLVFVFDREGDARSKAYQEQLEAEVCGE